LKIQSIRGSRGNRSWWRKGEKNSERRGEDQYAEKGRNFRKGIGKISFKKGRTQLLCRRERRNDKPRIATTSKGEKNLRRGENTPKLRGHGL